MERYGPEVCLFDNDILDTATQDIYDNLDGRSSGYESCDSLTPPPSPPTSPKVREPSSRQREVMLYSNMASLSDSLQYILNMPELCDVTFLVGKNRDPVHGVKAILATRSRVFYQMILHHQRKASEALKPKSRLRRNKSRQDDSSVHSPLQIPVPDYDYDVFSSLVSFLHSGRVRVQAATGTGLLCAAVEFGLKDLHMACWDFIKRCHGQGEGHREVLLKSAERYRKKKGAQKLLNEIQCRNIY